GAVGTGTGASPVPTDGQEHVLLLTLHHIITDGWSMRVLTHEVTALYQASVSGQSSLVGFIGSGTGASPVPTAPDHRLPPLPIQYADYALWQREWLQGTTLQQQLHYWRMQLQGAPSLLSLPTDYSRPPIQTIQGATLTKLVPSSLLEQLKMLSQQANVT